MGFRTETVMKTGPEDSKAYFRIDGPGKGAYRRPLLFWETNINYLKNLFKPGDLFFLRIIKTS